MKLRILIAAAAFLAIFSCKQKTTGKDLMPEMAQTDSIELIYFRTPDSTRFFTYLPMNDEEFIKEIVKDISGEVQEDNPCSKEGKIYCFANGQVTNTIFFAYSDKNCTLFRYIKNGNLYYFKMSDKVKEKLMKFKSFSREPVPKDSTTPNL